MPFQLLISGAISLSTLRIRTIIFIMNQPLLTSEYYHVQLQGCHVRLDCFRSCPGSLVPSSSGIVSTCIQSHHSYHSAPFLVHFHQYPIHARGSPLSSCRRIPERERFALDLTSLYLASAMLQLQLHGGKKGILNRRSRVP